MEEVALGTQGTTTLDTGTGHHAGARLPPSVTGFSGVQCFALLACPPILSLAGASQPYSPSFLPPPTWTWGVDRDPSLSLDLALLSGAGASPLAERWGGSSQETLALGLWPMRRGTHRDLGGKGDVPLPPGGPVTSASLYLRQAPCPRSRAVGAPGASAPPCRGPPLSPRAACGVSHQQDPFEGL